MSLDREEPTTLRHDELVALLAALLEREQPGAAIEEQHDSAVDLVVSAPDGRKTVVEAKVSARPIQLGVIDPEALQASAEREGAQQLLLVLAAPMSEEQLTRVREKVANWLRNVEVEVCGPPEIAALLDKYPDIRRRFFELQPESERRPFERVVLDLTPPPEAAHVPGWLRLTVLIGIVVLLVWLPMNLSDTDALIFAGIGLLLLALTYFSAKVSAAQVGGALETVVAVPTPSISVEVSAFGLPVRTEVQLRLQRVTPGPATLALMAFFFIALRGLRFVGALAYGLGFFLAWGLLYLALWGLDPSAFSGVDSSPAFGDFLYLAVGAAFLNPPPEPQAVSELARGLVAAELVSAGALLVAFATRLGLLRTQTPSD